jgi:hypothetical protein
MTSNALIPSNEVQLLVKTITRQKSTAGAGQADWACNRLPQLAHFSADVISIVE